MASPRGETGAVCPVNVATCRTLCGRVPLHVKSTVSPGTASWPVLEVAGQGRSTIVPGGLSVLVHGSTPGPIAPAPEAVDPPEPLEALAPPDAPAPLDAVEAFGLPHATIAAGTRASSPSDHRRALQHVPGGSSTWWIMRHPPMDQGSSGSSSDGPGDGDGAAGPAAAPPLRT